MRPAATVLAIGLLVCPGAMAQSKSGSVCVAPLPRTWTDTTHTENMVCPGRNYALKFDDHKSFSWPAKESVEISDLDAAATHKIIVYCGEQRLRSLSLDFSDYKTPQVALFLSGDGQTHFWVALYAACVQLEQSSHDQSTRERPIQH